MLNSLLSIQGAVFERERDRRMGEVGRERDGRTGEKRIGRREVERERERERRGERGGIGTVNGIELPIGTIVIMSNNTTPNVYVH